MMKALLMKKRLLSTLLVTSLIFSNVEMNYAATGNVYETVESTYETGNYTGTISGEYKVVK